MLDAMRPSLVFPKTTGDNHDSLSQSSNIDTPCDESHPHHKPCPKRPKATPAAMDWLSHQLMRDTNGNIVKCKPQFHQWFTSCVFAPGVKSKKLPASFRRRFRMKHSSSLTLLSLVKESHDFKKWTRPKWNNSATSPSPMELLVLGSLCPLGKIWTF